MHNINIFQKRCLKLIHSISRGIETFNFGRWCIMMCSFTSCIYGIGNSSCQGHFWLCKAAGSSWFRNPEKFSTSIRLSLSNNMTWPRSDQNSCHFNLWEQPDQLNFQLVELKWMNFQRVGCCFFQLNYCTSSATLVQTLSLGHLHEFLCKLQRFKGRLSNGCLIDSKKHTEIDFKSPLLQGIIDH